jgi:hypothetical protein
MAQESLPLWAAVSERQSRPILHRTGVLWFSPADDTYMANSLAWLRANGIAHETGDLAWLRDRFPQIAFRDGESGFVESDSGALIAGRGVQAVVADAGLEVEQAEASSPQRKSDGTYEVAGNLARNLVYACGPWLPHLFPEVLEGRIVATRQEVYHFAPAPGDTRFAPPSCRSGPISTPATSSTACLNGRAGLQARVRPARARGRSRHAGPALSDGRHRRGALVHRRAFPRPCRCGALSMAGFCQYENSSNGDFLLDRLAGIETRSGWSAAVQDTASSTARRWARRMAAHIADRDCRSNPASRSPLRRHRRARTIY